MSVASPTELRPHPRPGRPSKADAADLDQALLTAALAVFLDCGYAGASIDAIVARARMSKRTVYSRHASKAVLFEAAIARHMEEKLAGLEAPTDDRLDLRGRLIVLGRALHAAATDPQTRAIDHIVMSEAALFPELAKRLHQFGFLRIANLVAEIMQTHGAAGGGLAAEAFYALLALSPMRALAVDPDAPPPDVAQVVDFVLAGAGLLPERAPCP